jgi:hypothetical protein
MSLEDYCPHCRCDESHPDPQHGPNCPRYRGPSTAEDLAERVEQLEWDVKSLTERIERLERQQ